jgi:hypothetical protein
VAADTPSIATPLKKHVIFANKGNDPDFEAAQLFYMDHYWGQLGHADAPHSVNSYEGQVWHVKVHGVVQKTFVVGMEERQEFVV